MQFTIIDGLFPLFGKLSAGNANFDANSGHMP